LTIFVGRRGASGATRYDRASTASEDAFDDRLDRVAIHLRRERALDPGHGRADLAKLASDFSNFAAVLADCELDPTEPAVDVLTKAVELVAYAMNLVAYALERLAEDVEFRVQIFEDDQEWSVAAGGLPRSLLSGDHSFSSH
jgi:hypothetical protein